MTPDYETTGFVSQTKDELEVSFLLREAETEGLCRNVCNVCVAVYVPGLARLC